MRTLKHTPNTLPNSGVDSKEVLKQRVLLGEASDEELHLLMCQLNAAGNKQELNQFMEENWLAVTEEVEMQPRKTTAILTRIREDILPEPEAKTSRMSWWKSLFLAVVGIGLLFFMFR